MRRQPPGDTRTCYACGRDRGNTRKGWSFTVRDGTAVAVSCEHCPRYDEPIRRLDDNGVVRFRAVVDATPPGARKRRQVTRTLNTLAEARAFVTTVHVEVTAQGAYQSPAVETVAALCARWLDGHSHVRPVTLEGYRNHLTPALRRIGDADATTVTVRDVEGLARWLSTEGGSRGQPLGPRSVRGALVALGQAFGLLVREGTIPSNPVRLARPPRVRQKLGQDLEHWTPRPATPVA